MPFDPNDPRLTAYALGELDESEIAEIEAQLADSAESRAAVDEVRAAARLLTVELSRESRPGVAPIQVDLIEKSFATAPVVSIPFSKRPVFRLVRLGLAASLVAAVGLAYYGSRPGGFAAPGFKPIAIARSPIAAPAPAPKLELPEKRAIEFDAVPPAIGDISTADNNQLDEKLDPGVLPINDSRRSPTNPSTNRLAGRDANLSKLNKSKAPAPGPAQSPLSTGQPFGLAENGPAPGRSSAPPRSAGKTFAYAGAAPSGGAKDDKASVASRARTEVPGDRSKSAASTSPAKPGITAPMSSPALLASSQPPALAAPVAPLSPMNVEVSRQQQSPLGLAPQEVQQVLPPVPLGGFEPAPVMPEAANAEVFAPVVDNPFLRTVVEANRLSTFSIDVDTASYSLVRRFLNEGRMPPRDAARIEEMVNYFPYDYPTPQGDAPFSITAEIARCPWNGDHRLARIGLKAREIATDRRPASNLVFLVDVSGSMDAENKLPLVREGLRMLVEKLGGEDRVAIVVYASRTAVELPSTSITGRGDVLAAIEKLRPGGSTNGGAGITLAYEEASKHFIPGGTNRVILCTDGDFNVGVTDDAELTRLIESKAKESKVFLSVLGFGVGDLKDARMKALADHGNGNYAYIDTLAEARKVLVDQMSATLVTIAKDVKVQVEFNPARVGAYRLLGYENRLLRAEDFNNDAKDAGEIGAGHTVTALYEIVPPGKEGDLPGIDKLKYSRPNAPIGDPDSKESMTVKLRFKPPEGDESRKVEVALIDEGREYPEHPEDFKFAAAVAEFGMLLRDSPYKGSASFAACREHAESSRGSDPFGYRAAFLDLVGKAERLTRPVMRAVK